MCTAVSFNAGDHYFGRNLDLEFSYNQEVVICPRNYAFHFRNGNQILKHYAIIGAAKVVNDYPLYFDATNEVGLSVAGLNFPNNAYYFPKMPKKNNISPFELIPWLLCRCKSIPEAKVLLTEMNLWDEPFSEEYPLSPLHWLMTDRNGAVTIECTQEGLRLYDNPVGILTNNPPFPYHMHNLSNYMALTKDPPINHQPITLTPYSLGMGSFGLPGDMSSGSRFVKAAFTKMHSICDENEQSAVNQFFHILSSVCQQKGLSKLENGTYEYTQYSSCCNTDKGIYYYTTYENSSITAVEMFRENLDSSRIISYPFLTNAPIKVQN